MKTTDLDRAYAANLDALTVAAKRLRCAAKAGASLDEIANLRDARARLLEENKRFLRALADRDALNVIF